MGQLFFNLRARFVVAPLGGASQGFGAVGAGLATIGEDASKRNAGSFFFSWWRLRRAMRRLGLVQWGQVRSGAVWFNEDASKR